MIEATELSIWEPTAQLRWRQSFFRRTSGACFIEERLPDVLQQLWSERYSGKTEWRDVPCEP